MRKTARLSPCGKYRYVLTRTWDSDKPVVVWVMLNPSKADHRVDDPTVKKCIGFSRRWGYGGIVVLNLYAFRSTDPLGLVFAGNGAVGPRNREEIDRVFDGLGSASPVIVAWGAHDLAGSQIEPMIELIEAHGKPPLCLGVTKDGRPKHPLYVPYGTGWVPYPPPRIGEVPCPSTR